YRDLALARGECDTTSRDEEILKRALAFDPAFVDTSGAVVTASATAETVALESSPNETAKVADNKEPSEITDLVVRILGAILDRLLGGPTSEQAGQTLVVPDEKTDPSVMAIEPPPMPPQTPPAPQAPPPPPSAVVRGVVKGIAPGTPGNTESLWKQATPLKGAKITVVESGKSVETDSKGGFAIVGRPRVIHLVVGAPGYREGR